MDDKKKPGTRTETKTENTPPGTEAAKEPSYALGLLRRDCIKLFGVSASTFDGAIATHMPEGNYTIAEVKEILDNWLKKQVCPAEKKEDK